MASPASYAPVLVAFGATVVGVIVDVATAQNAPAAVVIPALALVFALARRRQSDAVSLLPLVLTTAVFAWLRLPNESVNSIEVIYAIFSLVFSLVAGVVNVALVGAACAIVGRVPNVSSDLKRAAYGAAVALVVMSAALSVLAIRTAVRTPTERAWIKAQPVIADWPDPPSSAPAERELDHTRAYQVVSEQRVRCGEHQVVRQRFDNGECSLSYGAERMPPSTYRGEPGDFGDFVRTCGPARVRCSEVQSQAIVELADTGLIVYVASSSEPKKERWNGFDPKFAPRHVWWICGVIGVLAAIAALVLRRPAFAIAFALFAGTPLAVALKYGLLT